MPKARRTATLAAVLGPAVLLAGCSTYGAERAGHQPSAGAPPTTGVTAPPASEPSGRPTRPASAETPQARPAVLEPGATGPRVRELQARLTQLAWMEPPTTGTYDGSTRTAVKGFQAKRGFRATGVVDRRTWRRLLEMTIAPSRAELFNEAGPALFSPGDSGRQVREIQARLRQIGWYFGDVTDHYGDKTAAAVTGFQGKRRIPATGRVDRRTLDLLEGMTREPTRDELDNVRPDPADGAPLDPRCTTGRALCVDKSSNSLRWVVDGTVLTAVDVRFGGNGYSTREGLFHVYRKSRHHVSSLYDTSMPFAMFFSGGQAVHYSPDFAANGYNGASHGCVNVRDYHAIAALYDQVRIGDKVVVYWS